MGRAKELASVLVELDKNAVGELVMAKNVFVRDRGKKKWVALLSTDVDLADAQIIALYKRRWDSEVFFKITWSYLNLAKSFRAAAIRDERTQHIIIQAKNGLHIIIAVA